MLGSTFRDIRYFLATAEKFCSSCYLFCLRDVWGPLGTALIIATGLCVSEPRASVIYAAGGFAINILGEERHLPLMTP